MTSHTTGTSSTAKSPGRREFTLLIAMMFGIVAFSIDSMLPALPMIAADLGLPNAQLASYVMLIFLVGLGVGTLFAGPLSDAMGRRPVLFASLGIYAFGSFLSAIAPSFEMMMAARLLQGIGAAGPRVVSAAIVRDTYKGPAMAKILSMSIMVFLCIPTIAPAMGAGLTALGGWRSIFLAFLAFAILLSLWFGMRQPETLPVENRRPVRVSLLWAALKEMFSHPIVRPSVLAQALVMGSLFSLLSMVQPIFEVTYGRGATFPYWFGAIAIVSAISSVLNAGLVGRFGMRRLIAFAMNAQIVVTLVSLALLSFAPSTGVSFFIYIFWQACLFMMAGLTQANLTSFAAEPMGHIAGFASSVIAAVSTIAGTVIGFGAALLFDGTPGPLLAIVAVLLFTASILMSTTKAAEARLAAE